MTENKAPKVKTEKRKVNLAFKRPKDRLNRPDFFLLAGEYLWLIENNKIFVTTASTRARLPLASPEERTCVETKTRKKKQQKSPIQVGLGGGSIGFDCGPDVFVNSQIERGRFGYAPRGIWHSDDKVIVAIGYEHYYFLNNGTFLEKKVRKDFWRLHTGQYGQNKWTIGLDEATFNPPDFDSKDSRAIVTTSSNKAQQSTKIFYKNGHESVTFKKKGTIFSGRWVLLLQSDESQKTSTITLLNRSTAELGRQYSGWQPKGRVFDGVKYRFREYEEGFYIDEISNKYYRPIAWFGEKVMDFRDEDGNKFCYVFEEEKKCIDDPLSEIREVVENEFMRVITTSDNSMYREDKG